MWQVGVNFHVRPGTNLSGTTVIYSTGGKKKKKKGDKETDSRSETPAEEPQASGAGSPAPDAQAPDSEEAPAGDSEEVAMPKTVSIRVKPCSHITKFSPILLFKKKLACYSV